MLVLTKKNIKGFSAAKIPLSDESLTLTHKALTALWEERCAERGLDAPTDRSGSCKFAALLARDLFGGRLSGNNEHVFVTLEDGYLLDLNDQEPDVNGMGNAAHTMNCFVLTDIEYREALGSCMPRVERWSSWVISELEEAQLEHDQHYDLPSIGSKQFGMRR